jgi:RNA polymerase sigma factor (sigma-70 family)
MMGMIALFSPFAPASAVYFRAFVIHLGGVEDISEPAFPGDSTARDTIALRAALARYFRARIGDPIEAEDLVQEVFARIAARKGDAPIVNLSGYMFQTAASLLTDRARRRGARRAEAHVPIDPDRHADLEPDPYRVLAGKEDLRIATAALQALPVRTRTIFVLHRLDGMKYRDVATQLGISVSAVEKHMVRAVQHISAAMGGRE